MQNIISFKSLSTSDIKQIYDWTQQPHVKKWWQDPEDWEEFKNKFEDKLISPDRACFVIYIENKSVGYIQTYQANKFPEWTDQPDGTYGMDLFIGNPNFIGKGFGTEIVKLFVEKIFENSKATRIIINPDVNNIAAIRAYEKAGFKKLHEIKRENDTEILMEINKN